MSCHSHLLYAKFRRPAPYDTEGFVNIIQGNFRMAVWKAVLEYYAGYPPVGVSGGVGVSFGSVPDGTVAATGADYHCHSVRFLGDEERECRLGDVAGKVSHIPLGTGLAVVRRGSVGP